MVTTGADFTSVVSAHSHRRGLAREFAVRQAGGVPFAVGDPTAVKRHENGTVAFDFGPVRMAVTGKGLLVMTPEVVLGYDAGGELRLLLQNDEHAMPFERLRQLEAERASSARWC